MVVSASFVFSLTSSIVSDSRIVISEVNFSETLQLRRQRVVLQTADRT